MKKVLKIIAINILILIVLLAIIDFSSMIIVNAAIARHELKSNSGASKPNAKVIGLPNYKNSPWVNKYFQEINTLKSDYISYYEWRSREYKGETINIDSNGIRKTTGTFSEGAPIALFLGGSAMWGTGANDDGTIPSIFKKEIGDKYNVINYGETGYSAYQSLIFLQTQIAKGLLDSVNLIISYDGVNNSLFRRKYFSHPREDQINSLLHKAARVDYIFMEHTRTLIRKVKSKNISPPTPILTEVEDKNCAIALLNTWVMMHDLSKSMGADFLCILQPNIFVGSPDISNISSTQDHSARRNCYKFYKYVNEYIYTKDEYKHLRDCFIDLTGAFDNMPNVYIDFCHVSPNGNDVIVANLLEYLKIK